MPLRRVCWDELTVLLPSPSQAADFAKRLLQKQQLFGAGAVAGGAGPSPALTPMLHAAQQLNQVN
jgi:hypothetical protein